MKISIIIPIYNSSKYLKKCLDSIVNQSIKFKNVQLILINDGSTDDSEKIINTYLNKYENIIYVYQKNSGQAVARNNGLNLATCEYVSFVDSDDWLELTYCEKMIKHIGRNDICFCNTFLDYDDYKLERKMLKYENIINNFIIMNTAPHSIIFRKKFLDRVKFEFPVGMIYEDLASIPSLASKTDKICYLDEYLYHYSQLGTSTVRHHVYNKKILDIYKALELYEKNIGDNYIKFYEEIEFVYIYNLILLAGGGFIKYSETKGEIKHIRKIMANKFPNWKKNKYYKGEKFIIKFKINLLYNNKINLYKLLKKIENIFNRMRRLFI